MPTSFSGDNNAIDAQEGASRSVGITRRVGSSESAEVDSLTVEEPLQIRLAGEDVAVTMRTPGNDLELAAGFLFTEGIIAGKNHIEQIGYCAREGDLPDHNVVNVLPEDRSLLSPQSWGRNFISSSSCGLCGKTSITQVKARTPSLSDGSCVHLDALYSLEAKLRNAQRAFAQTGGIHAAALFSVEGDLIVLREDIGRHNAVDKVVGYALFHDLLPLMEYILLVSSRASFEIVQKAAVAGIAIMAALSAPSTLAVELAAETGMTLVAFLRDNRCNVYTRGERIVE